VSEDDLEGRVLAMLGPHVRSGIEPRPDTDIVADAGMDSVAVMDFVLDLEEGFDVTIPLDRLSDVRTVSDVVREVREIVGENAR
jgi:acyl carrier protein